MTSNKDPTSSPTSQCFPQHHTLSFGSLIKINEHILEVIINEGVELNLLNVDEYHQWINEHFEDSCYVLVNRLNAYSHTFEAQQIIGTLDKIKAIAIVAYSDFSFVVSQNIAQTPREKAWTIQVLNDKKSALIWLNQQIDLNKTR